MEILKFQSLIKLNLYIFQKRKEYKINRLISTKFGESMTEKFGTKMLFWSISDKWEGLSMICDFIDYKKLYTTINKKEKNTSFDTKGPFLA